MNFEQKIRQSPKKNTTVAKFLQTKKKSKGCGQTKKKSKGCGQNEKKSKGCGQKHKFVKLATEVFVEKKKLNFGGDRFGSKWPISVHKKKPTHILYEVSV